VVLNQAFGGLVVASCIKYADNIMKNFASSGAIVLGGAASVFFFNFQMTPQFAVGAGIVVASMLVYDPTLCDSCSAEPMPSTSKASGEEEGLITEEEGLITEKEGLITEEEGLITEEEGLITEEEGLITEEEGLITEEEGLITEEEGLITEEEGLITKT
jgi:hypothetical protein